MTDEPRRLLADLVICGPGEMEQGHRADEYLEEGQLDDAVRFLERLVATLT